MAADSRLSEKRCKACTPETPPLKGEELQRFFRRLEGDWELKGEHHLTRRYRFDNFRKALDFTVAIGEMSEEEGHHPEILLAWGVVTITVYTHAIDALSESDFIWAAKAEKIYRERFASS